MFAALHTPRFAPQRRPYLYVRYAHKRATLAHVREQFGSAAGYLVLIGVPPESVSRIRVNLTEMPPS